MGRDHDRHSVRPTESSRRRDVLAVDMVELVRNLVESVLGVNMIGILPDLPYMGLDWEFFFPTNLYIAFINWWNPF